MKIQTLPFNSSFNRELSLNKRFRIDNRAVNPASNELMNLEFVFPAKELNLMVGGVVPTGQWNSLDLA